MPDTQQPLVGQIPAENRLELKIINEKLIDQEKLFIEKLEGLEKWLKEIRNGDQKALELQAKEYERRLEALNHEADQLKTMQDKYVPREVFDRVVDELQKNSQINSDYRIKQEGQGQGKGAYGDLFKWLVPVLLTITFFLIMYFTQKSK